MKLLFILLWKMVVLLLKKTGKEDMKEPENNLMNLEYEELTLLK